MHLLFALIPVFAILAATYLYKHNGKRDILFFDTVQFFYCFIMTPVLFLWLKTFLFFILRTELDLRLSVTELFIADSAFTLFGLYIFAFVVIHSLTKSFNLKKKSDPLYDLFYHSEYLHLWLSHLVMFIGAMIVLTIFAATNIFFPLMLTMTQPTFYLILVFALVVGICGFMMIWLSDPKQGNFMRLMKLSFGIFFLLHVLFYFWLDPRFQPAYTMYWVSFMIFTAMVTSALFFHRSARATTWYNSLKHTTWGKNINLFEKK